MVDQPKDYEEICVDKEELRQAVAEGIKDAFISFGLDTEQAIAIQEDMHFLRNWRLFCIKTRMTALLVAITAALGGALSVLWLGWQTLNGQIG